MQMAAVGPTSSDMFIGRCLGTKEVRSDGFPETVLYEAITSDGRVFPKVLWVRVNCVVGDPVRAPHRLQKVIFDHNIGNKLISKEVTRAMYHPCYCLFLAGRSWVMSLTQFPIA